MYWYTCRVYTLNWLEAGLSVRDWERKKRKKELTCGGSLLVTRAK